MDIGNGLPPPSKMGANVGISRSFRLGVCECVYIYLRRYSTMCSKLGAPGAGLSGAGDEDPLKSWISGLGLRVRDIVREHSRYFCLLSSAVSEGLQEHCP